MMVSALVLGALVLAEEATVAGVIALAAVTGTAFAFDQPARRTLVTELVEEDDATNAISLNSVVANTARMVGPLVAGILVPTIGVGWCFIANGVSSLAVLGALKRMDTTAIRRVPSPPDTRGFIRQGLRYVAHILDVRIVLVMLGAVSLLGFNWNVLLPLLVTRDLDIAPEAFGVLLGIMSFGSLVGLLWQARRPRPDTRFLAVVCVAFGAATVVLASAPNVVFAAMASLAIGATSIVLFNGTVVEVQLSTAPAMRGRVMGIFSTVFIGTYGVGGLLAGWLGDQVGARAAFGLAGVTALLTGAIAIAAVDSRRAAALEE